MKKLKMILGLALCWALFTVGFCAWAQTNGPAGPAASGVTVAPGGQALLLALIPLVVPILIIGLKKAAPNIPPHYLPIVAPLLGMGLDLLMNYGHTNLLLTALLGSGGVGLREIVDQVKQRAATTGNAAVVGVAILTSGLLLAGPGCAHLDPGARAIVVRAEQTETIAKDTLDTFLKVDNGNRSFFRTNAPGMHAFAESLRKPVTVNGVSYPQWVGWIHSLDNVKQAYKLSTVSSNALIEATATLSAAVSQAAQYIAVTATNGLPGK